MKITLKLLKPWKNGSTIYPDGSMLQVEKNNAQELIDQGLAIEIDSTTGKQKGSFNPNAFTCNDTHEAAHAGVPAAKFWRRDDTGSDAHKSLGEVFQKASGMSEGSGPDGGYAVPVSYHNRIVATGLENDMLLSRCYNINSPSNKLEIPYLADYDRTTGLYGIDVPGGIAEGGPLASKKMTIGKLTLSLSKSGYLLPLSNELLEDAPLLAGDMISRVLGETLLNETLRQIISGTGAGQALGIMNAPSLITVDAEDAQAADTIAYENIVKMFARANSRTKKNGVWICSPNTIPQLFTLSLAIGTGGSHVSLIENGISGTPSASIFGRPVFFCEHASALGDEGDIIFANMQDYALARKMNDPIRISQSQHLKFDTDEHVFRVISRFDGQPLQSQAQTPANGGDTLSSFVTLEARA